jgi:hypothetical protein
MLRAVQAKEVPLFLISGGTKSIIDMAMFHVFNELESDFAGNYGQGLEEYTVEKVDALSARFNTLIIANQFIFETKENPKSGRVEQTVVDYDKRVLHTMNKNEFVTEHFHEEFKAKVRPNVLLMGDILEDADMVRDEEHDTVIRIGFLNNIDHDESQTEKFLSTFDIVVTEDGPLLPVNFLLLHLLGSDRAMIEKEME